MLDKPAFADGKATTAFIAENYAGNSLAAPAANAQQQALGACLLYRAALADSQRAAVSTLAGAAGFSGMRDLRNHVRFGEKDSEVDVYVREVSTDSYRVSINVRIIVGLDQPG